MSFKIPRGRQRKHSILCSVCKNCMMTVPDMHAPDLRTKMEELGWRVDAVNPRLWICALCAAGIDVNAITGTPGGRP